MTKKQTILIAGGFLKTKSLADSLVEQGYEVRIINKESDACTSLAKSHSYWVVHGDASKPYVLDEADIDTVDIVIALTHSDADNLVICELAKKKYHVQKTVAVVNDPRKIPFFYQMGVDSVVCATNAIVAIIEQQTLMNDLTNVVPIGEGQCNIMEIPMLKSAPVLNRQLQEIALPKGVIIGCILRGEENVVPNGSTTILEGDVLVVISANNKEMEAIRVLTGKQHGTNEA